ncbi:crotonobetainyl-CoA:carnitine CoA-transferase CaiB-like acyl-CoA transferase [Humitalea rosea]|uniref:Crotonobetainyl-CoA:carnitine CoA-transferase CaiB-like acyl-CoA transferase n=1 Tax=Humitalea rosea TaxID=990373 RepID=A0A2W7I9N0_9PROT|nr:CoA transferase [Humitalea rosea]PZW43089.1 crotonobetainyl-CoA:carnitine CoA-transferase CaiB-like acyl-CoA transferase [Humitalea rosea]
MADPAPLPLAGMFVVEIGHSLAGPFAGMVLADLGATVLKVENAGKGDHARDWGPPFAAGAAVLFHAVNRGKRSLRADLRDPGTAAALRALILDRADVVLQNLRVGTLDAVGLGGPALTEAKPSLVYCNIGAFGHRGPQRNDPGYDPLIQAASGLMSMLGHPGEPASRVPVAINDIGTGIWAALGILAALLRRKDTGRGGIVDVSLYETALAWLTVPASDYLASGLLPERLGSGVGNIVPHQAFDCADGPIMIAAGNDLLFARLCAALGLPGLATDPRFATNGGRVANRTTLIVLLAEAVRLRTTQELSAALAAAGVPCGPVLTLDAALAHPQTQALGMLAATPEDGVRTVALPVSFDGHRPPLAGRAPRLGEHQHMLATAPIKEDAP